MEDWTPHGVRDDHADRFQPRSSDTVWIVPPVLTRGEEWMLAFAAKLKIELRSSDRSYEGVKWYEALPRVKSVRAKIGNTIPEEEKATLRRGRVTLEVEFENTEDVAELNCPLAFVDKYWTHVQRMRLVRDVNAELDRDDARQAIAMVGILHQEVEGHDTYSKAFEWVAMRTTEIFEGKEAGHLARIQTRAENRMRELLEEGRAVVLTRTGNSVRAEYLA